MSCYDRSDWHYGGDYPEDLPDENAATHIGMFLAWCMENNLVSEELIEQSAEAIERVKKHELTGAEFLIEECDEKFWSSDLSDEGNAFAGDYYEDGTEFSKKFHSYMEDYCDAFNQKAEKEGFEYPSVYHVENNWENYAIVKKFLDRQYSQWKNSRDDAELKWVWVFHGINSEFSNAVFSSKETAESWIETTGVQGMLTKMPLDVSCYDWAMSRGYFKPKSESQRESEFIQRFTSGYLEHYHYVKDDDGDA
jgi:hypothetical protein